MTISTIIIFLIVLFLLALWNVHGKPPRTSMSSGTKMDANEKKETSGGRRVQARRKPKPPQIKEPGQRIISKDLPFQPCPYIGIDLGTTNSKVCGVKDRKLIVIPDGQGDCSTPSVVMLTNYGGCYVGKAAKKHVQRFESVNLVVGSIKRKILKERGTIWNGKKQYPQFLFALILAALKKQAEDYLGCSVIGSVISVPASFGVDERQIIKDAAEISGLEVLRLLNEPTAASLVYGMNPALDHRLFVYDFGGGTFDASIVEAGSGVIKVIGTCGDMSLGGKDFDDRLIEYLCKEIASKFEFDVKKHPIALMRLEEAAEETKKNLSFSESAELSIPYFSGNEHLSLIINRSTFEELTKDLIDKSLDICKKTLTSAGLSKGHIDGVLLTGGQTRMPAIRRAVEHFFGNKIVPGVDADTLVVKGNMLQCAVLTGGLRDMLLLDVQSHSLGVGVVGHEFVKLVERNTILPLRAAKQFSTTQDNQASINFQIFEGERADVRENKCIGSLTIDGLFPAKAGTPQIDITFDVDPNGMLVVSASDLATGKSNKKILVSQEKLSQCDMHGLIDLVRKWVKSENAKT